MIDHGKERTVKGIFLLSFILAGSFSALIFFFLFYFSMPLLTSGLMGKFLINNWNPDNNVIGIYPMMVGTGCIAGLSLLMAAPMGIGLAAFIHVFAPKPLGRLFRWIVELMAGIPTVVYGFAALFLLVPAIRMVFKYGTGLCVLTASLMLALLILPTIVLIAEDGFKAVPEHHILAARALGATSVETFFYVILPGARQKLVSAVVLGAGRAVGDTLIALMLAGNALALPESLLDPARTLTSHIALVTAADYESLSFKAIFACGLVLFVFSAWNVLFLRFMERIKK